MFFLKEPIVSLTFLMKANEFQRGGSENEIRPIPSF